MNFDPFLCSAKERPSFIRELFKTNFSKMSIFELNFFLDLREVFVFNTSLMSSEESAKKSKTPLEFSWKDTDQLSKFVTETGKILPKQYTRLSSKEQRHICKQIKRARNLLLMK